MMESWYELEQILLSVVVSDDEDAPIWQNDNKGAYSTSSLYNINILEVCPPYSFPQFGLCQSHKNPNLSLVMSHNKSMTRDNLKQTNMDKPEDCILCSKNEIVAHLFLDCAVAKEI